MIFYFNSFKFLYSQLCREYLSSEITVKTGVGEERKRNHSPYFWVFFLRRNSYKWHSWSEARYTFKVSHLPERQIYIPLLCPPKVEPFGYIRELSAT